MSTLSGAAERHAGPVPPVHELFAERAALVPDAPAVRGDGAGFTYRRLDESANRLAHRLRERGAGPGRRVAVRLPRTPDLVVCLLAVLKTGAAYVPLDPAHPESRAEWAVRETGAVLLVTTAGGYRPDATETLEMDDPVERERVAALAPTAPPVSVDPADLAYVVYTSGSTGRPKGVMVPHEGLSRYSLWAARTLGAERGAPLHTSVAFDLALTGLYPVLVEGGAVTVVDGEGVEPLVRTLGDRTHGLVKLTPSHLDALAATGAAAESMAHSLVVGGERLLGEQLDPWRRAAPDTVVVNSYGPSETTVACCAHTVRAGDLPDGPVPIGRPIAGAVLHVLDAALEPVADGEPGELYVAGPGVARGYVGAPALTGERFLPDPQGPPGARMYRTGDVVRRLPQGELEFLHRIDDQVKIDGYRIEPGEVEALVREHPAVRAAAVAAVTVDGRTELAVHAVPKAGGIDPRELRAHLAERLPGAAVPVLWSVVPELPLLPNGKLDRAALPRAQRLGRGTEPPRGPLEERVAALWREVLGLDSVGRDDDFVELGGRSLPAARVAGGLARETGVRISAGDVLSAGTVAALADLVEGAEPDRSASVPAPAPGSGPAPLSATQRRLWFLDRLHPGGTEYLVPVVLRLRGELDPGALSHALTRLVARHEVLRTRYRTDPAGDPVQVVDPPFPVEAVVEDAEPDAVVEEELSRPVDLAAGPVLRARLVRVDAREHVLVLVVHHIATDGWSTGLITEELADHLAGNTDRAGVPAPAAVTYRDYAHWQREHLQGAGAEDDLEYWRNRLSGLEVAELHTDRPRTRTRDTRGATHRFTIPARLAERLRALAVGRRTTPFMAYLAGWYALTFRRTGRTDLAVGVPVSGRTAPGTEDLVGFLANTAVMRTDVSGDPEFTGILDRVRETAVNAYAHEGVPFDRVVEAVAPERDITRNPLFQVMFVFQEGGKERFALPGLDIEREDVEGEAARFDLTVEFTPAADGSVRGRLTYAAALFDHTTVRTMADHYLRILEHAVRSPETSLERLAVLAPEERRALLDSARGPYRERPGPGLPELVADQAARTPMPLPWRAREGPSPLPGWTGPRTGAPGCCDDGVWCAATSSASAFTGAPTS